MTTILVIEDDLMISDSIVEVLENEGYVVISAENGKQGVEQLSQYLPQLVLCDVDMPEMTGHQVLSTIRDNPELGTLPFIFLTGKGEREDVRHGMQLGADDYLTKPFTPDELCSVISTQLQKQRVRQSTTERQLNRLRNSISQTLPEALMKPLSDLVAMSELLRVDGRQLINSPEGSAFLEELHQSSQTVRRLAENFFLYLNIELMLSHPDLRAMLQESHHRSQSLSVITQVAEAKAKQCDRFNDLIVSVEETSLQIAEDDLSKMVEEILDNAFRFSEPGTLVQIEGQHTGNIFSLSISDRGVGMTPEQLAQLSCFQQLGQGLYARQSSGLGLAITHKILELYDGKLFIESIPYLTTIVRLELPIAQPE